MTRNYQGLTDYLNSQTKETVSLPFTQIDKLVGNLPQSARKHAAWWSNSVNSQPHSKYWLNAGRKARPDFNGGRVYFTGVPKSSDRQIFDTGESKSPATPKIKSSSINPSTKQIKKIQNIPKLKLTTKRARRKFRRQNISDQNNPSVPVNIRGTISLLSQARPIFHNEADFQHALAWQLHIENPTAEIRLETRPLASKPFYMDLLMRHNGSNIGFELKYMTKEIFLQHGWEEFALKTQGAQDVRRYDILKDVTRIEEFVKCGAIEKGYIIALTNDPLYWKQGRKTDPVDKDFHLFETRTISGSLKWSASASKGTTSGRDVPLDIDGHYEMKWFDYNQNREVNYLKFRYLLIEIA